MSRLVLRVKRHPRQTNLPQQVREISLDRTMYNLHQLVDILGICLTDNIPVALMTAHDGLFDLEPSEYAAVSIMEE